MEINKRTLDWFMNDPVWYKLVMQGRLFMRANRALSLRLERLTPTEQAELADFIGGALASLDTPLARRRKLVAA